MRTQDFKDLGFFFKNEKYTIFLSHEEITVFKHILNKNKFIRFDSDFDSLTIEKNLPFQELTRIFKFRDKLDLPVSVLNNDLFIFIESSEVKNHSSLSAAAYTRVLELKEIKTEKTKTENRLSLVDIRYFKPNKNDIVVSDSKKTNNVTVNPIFFKDWVLLLSKAKSFKTQDPLLLNLKECFKIV